VTGAFRHYLHLGATNEEYQRILLIDGPTVLGWADWRALQSEFLACGMQEALRMLMDDQGLVATQPTEPLANMLQAALNEAALAMANTNLTAGSSQAISEAFINLLAGLRVHQNER